MTIEAIGLAVLSGVFGLLVGFMLGDWRAWLERKLKQAEHDPKMRTKANLANVGPRDTRNKRSVWSITTKAFNEAHFATMAPELARTCIMAGCPLGGTVLDPFGGAGTTGLVADQLQRNAVLIELNPEYVAIARKRIDSDAGMFATETA